MKEVLTRMTRKGQITVPIEVRRALGLKRGDQVAVSVPELEQQAATLRPVQSVAESTFGAVAPNRRPEDLKGLRRAFEESVAKDVLAETSSRDP